ncbi:MAG: hypothetical protein Q8R02_23510 [Hyphomonadaceae bacterium]|nr:hypothetical protein [Hyphomonadaceae bacterium]
MPDEIVAPVVATEGQSAPVEQAPEPTVDDTMREVLAEIRAREPVQGADGKFQPKVVAQGAPEGTEVPGKPELAAPEPAPPAIDAPQSLPDDVKKVWSTLPPAVQQAWAKRESEATQKITTDGQRIKDLSSYEEALKPFAARLQQVNAPPQEYIRRLAMADQMLATNPAQGIQEVARLYGIDLQQMLTGQPDPSSALTRKISELESRLEDREKADEAVRTKSAHETINEFKKDKPHFEALQDLMDQFIRTGAAAAVPTDEPLLAKAYKLALAAHPEVGSKIETEAKAAAEKKAAEEAKERQAKDAKIAPFARRPGSAPAVANTKGSWEDTMKEVQAEIKARG